jgi:hypothetical protein
MSDMFPSDPGRGTRGEWRDHAGHVGRRTGKLAADFDARRAVRLTGHRSVFRRLLGRLRPRRPELRGDPHSSYGTFNDPGR